MTQSPPPMLPRSLRRGTIRLLDGSRVAYWRGGTGEPVLLLHGIADSSLAWKHIAGPLAEHHDVIALDLPGCGESDKPDIDYSLGNQAAAVRHCLDALDVDRCTVIGHSLGGGVGMTFSYQSPERVGRMCLISSAGLGTDLHVMFRLATLPIGPEPVMRVMFSPWSRAARTAAIKVLRWDGVVADPVRHRTEINRVLDALGDAHARRAFLRMLRSAARVGGQAVSAMDRLHGTPGPLLVIWGRQDSIFPLEHGERAVQAVPGSRLVVLDNCGHMPMIEDPDGVCAAILEWMRTTRPVAIARGTLARREE